MIGDIIATIAHNHGIDVDAQTNERWRDVLSLLREFDTLADDSGISHHDALQELASFDRFAEHYGTVVLPARAYRPKDKALVEGVVKIIYTRIYTHIRTKIYIYSRIAIECIVKRRTCDLSQLD
jgi:hypothetical protein